MRFPLRPTACITLAVCLLAATLTSPAHAIDPGDPRSGQVPRDQIPEACRWDLEALFADGAAWRAEHDSVRAEIPALAEIAEDVADSPERFLAALRLRDELEERVNRLRIYAQCRRDVALESEPAATRHQRAVVLVRDLEAAAFSLEAAARRLDAEGRTALLAAEPGLLPWRHWLERQARHADPSLSPQVESLLDEAAAGAGSGGEIWQDLIFREIPYGEVVDDMGDTVQASWSQAWRALSSQDRGYRERSWRARQEGYGAFRSTLATLVADHLRATLFQARARGHETALTYCLGRHDLTPAIYGNLIETVRANLAPLHRWLSIRKRILGYEHLHPWDANVSLFPTVDRAFTWDEAVALTRQSLLPLGHDYGAIVEQAFAERWVDAYPHPGKSGGGYSSGAHPGVHPFVKMNFNGTIQEVSTLVHEIGHMVQATLVIRTQPPVDADYMPFMAEIASTTAEILFHDRMAGLATTSREKAYYLEQHLNNLASMLYSATLGAEFELQLYERVEKGEPVTAAVADALWLELNRDYYGPVMSVDDLEAHGWAGFLHWYLDYYMFSYATSFAASELFAARIAAEGQPAADDFLGFLAAGRSAPPLEILRTAGVDMSGPGTVEAAAQRMDQLLDEMEALLGGADM